ncbi:MAG TPA: alpha/beta fold hydrolase [Chloroflexi bacterium]|nr:alpha/beta fold hydrolase [Chloroflexota bacterium]
MPTFAVNGHNLYYEIRGDERHPPLVLLHHGLGAVSEWEPLIQHFSPRYRVIACDRWGYGRSDPRPDFDYGYLLADTQEAIALLDHLGIKRACVIGHSDGGTIALLLASQRPDLVRAMVVEAAHIYYEPKIHRGISYMLGGLRKGWLRPYLINLHGEKGPALGERWLTHWLEESNVPADLVAPDALSRIACPVLVVQGEDDEYATPQHAIDIAAALPESELWLIPGCGHIPHAAVKEQFLERVEAFFRRAGVEGEVG